MADREALSSFPVDPDQPLIGIIERENGRDVVIYFTQEQEVTASRGAIQAALRLAGAWQDLNWQDMEHELDRIRHETPPSPPLAI